MARPYDFLAACRRAHGPTFSYRLAMTPPTVVLTRPEDVRALYATPADVVHAGEGMELLEPLVGATSLLLLDEDPHLRQRRLLLRPFRGAALGTVLDGLDAMVEEAVAGWPSDRAVALHALSQELTIDVILRAVLGLDRGPQRDRIRAALARYVELGVRTSCTVPQLRRSFGPLGSWPAFLAARREVDDLLSAQLAARRAAPARGDVLGQLLAATDEAGRPLAEREIRDAIVTLLVAGHETTASTIAWAFERLAVHPEAQRELVDAIDRDDADDQLVAVVRETLRQRPPLPNTGLRVTREPLSIGGCDLGPGIGLTACAYLIHHDPDLHAEPHAFRPERFLGPPSRGVAWVPFGGGIRRCIGAPLAVAETAAVLRAVLTRFEVAVRDRGPQRAVRRSIAVAPAGGVVARLTPRRRTARPLSAA